MREILFRGKSIDNGEWVEGCFIINKSGRCFIRFEKPALPHFFNDVLEVDPDTVGQFTGTTDKNGTKIFEGDIVEYNNENFEIEYIKGFAAFSLRSVDNMRYAPAITTITTTRMSIIGNIHDNPELLEVNNE